MSSHLEIGGTRGLTLRRRLRAETGASTAVYAGMIVVVVILVLALIAGMTPVGQSLASGVSNQICKIFDLSCGGDDPGSSQNDDDTEHSQDVLQYVDPLRPGECVVASHEDGSSYYIKIGVVKVGESISFVQQREQYYDPATGEVKTRYYVIATDGASLAAEGGTGTKGEIGNSGIGADLSVEAGFDLKVGDSWSFGSEEEMNAFIEHYTDYRIQQMQLASEGGAGLGLWYALTDGFIDSPRTADKRSSTIEVNASANGDVGIRVGKDNEATGEQSIDLNAGVYVRADASEAYTHTDDLRPDHQGEYSETITYSGSIGGGVNAVFAGVEGSGSYEGATTFNYKPGPGGKPVLSSITFSQVTGGDLTWKAGNGPVNQAGDATGTVEGEDSSKNSHVTETTIEVTDANRAVVDQWMSESLVQTPEGDTFLLLPPNVLDPSAPYPDDPMAQLLYEQATNTNTSYDVTGDNFSIGGEVALGLKVGGGFSISSEDQTVAGSSYLESPTSPGAPRQRADNLVCN